MIEACSEFMLPIVENIVGSDPLPGARDAGHVRLSALGDDAVVLGAVALARSHVGRSPFKRQFVVRPKYPVVAQASQGEVTINDKTYARDIFITADGQVKKRPIDKVVERFGMHTPSARRNWKSLQGGPEVVFRRLGRSGQLNPDRRGPAILVPSLHRPGKLPTAEAILAQVESPQGRASCT